MKKEYSFFLTHVSQGPPHAHCTQLEQTTTLRVTHNTKVIRVRIQVMSRLTRIIFYKRLLHHLAKKEDTKMGFAHSVSSISFTNKLLFTVHEKKKHLRKIVRNWIFYMLIWCTENFNFKLKSISWKRYNFLILWLRFSWSRSYHKIYIDVRSSG